MHPVQNIPSTYIMIHLAMRSVSFQTIRCIETREKRRRVFITHKKLLHIIRTQNIYKILKFKFEKKNSLDSLCIRLCDAEQSVFSYMNRNLFQISQPIEEPKNWADLSIANYYQDLNQSCMCNVYLAYQDMYVWRTVVRYVFVK